MTVITVHAQAHTLTTVACIICSLHVPSHQATTGSLYANGAQAFACTLHMRERARWTLAWLRFELQQQMLGNQERTV